MNQMKPSSESGRTMLEMIGVLGIMGVIMYGAISGINYGMNTYKVNQTYNDVQDIIRNVQDLYSWSKTYTTQTNMMKASCDNDIFPSSCNGSGTCTCNDNECCTGSCQTFNQFSGCIFIRGISLNNNFSVTYTGIPAEACRRLMEMEWTNINVSGATDCPTASNTLVFQPK